MICCDWRVKLNFFLYINRNFVFLIGVTILLLFIITVFFKQINQINTTVGISEKNTTDADISKPRFAISNDSKKIYISANKGNFINRDEILLRDDVRFKSNEFSIITEKVIFNRDKETAQSDSKSLFKSKNAEISSDGFNIYDKGNKIIFYGNSYILLKWKISF